MQRKRKPYYMNERSKNPPTKQLEIVVKRTAGWPARYESREEVLLRRIIVHYSLGYATPARLKKAWMETLSRYSEDADKWRRMQSHQPRHNHEISPYMEREGRRHSLSNFSRTVEPFPWRLLAVQNCATFNNCRSHCIIWHETKNKSVTHANF